MKRALSCSKPTKMWIDGKCFEVKPFQKFTNKQSGSKEAAVISDSSSEEISSPAQYEINTTSEGTFRTSFRLPQSYFSKLCNFPHLDLISLEKTTKTTIVPKNGFLVITGDNKRNVIEVREEIHSVLGVIRNQSMALQFIAIPMRNDNIKTNFNIFKEEILNKHEIKGMHESIFQSPHKLHLTVVVFSLFDENEILEAKKALHDYKVNTLDPLINKVGPLKVAISGIDCMNTNFNKVDVLYAKAKIIDENEEVNLQTIVNGIAEHFYHRGLVQRYQDNVKLHMTLINTKYRKNSDSPKRNRWAKRQSFDATTIMEKYRDFHFGECDLTSIHLSLISSIGDDGFYKSISVINVE